MNDNELKCFYTFIFCRNVMPGAYSCIGPASQWTTLAFSFQPQGDVVPCHVILHPHLGQIKL